MEKEVITFKSGKFVFTHKYSRETLALPLVEATILYETVVDLPILPQLASRLQQDLIRRSIFGTAALEGNPLTEEQVGEILAESDRVKSKEKAETEIRNLQSAYDFINRQESYGSKIELSEDLIRRLHSLITSDVQHENNIPGQYRNHKVNVGNADHGGVYTPPKILADIETLMREYVAWINSDEVVNLPIQIRAALSHYYLGLIHPFGDGNGRTARIIEALLLQLSGAKYVPIMLSNHYYRNIDDYFWAFSQTIKAKDRDVTPFLEFFIKCYNSALREIKQNITFFIRRHALRDYYVFMRNGKYIAQRQHDLLDTLLDYASPFSLKDLSSVSQFNVLYRRVSERTARRDLKKLAQMQLLIIRDDGKYDINYRALG